MSDKTDVFRALTDPGIVFIRPTREIFMQDELHEAGREQVAAKGLPAGTSYAGWHWQQHGFTAAGALDGFQYVYWGGDGAVVRERLKALGPQGFLVHGGRTADEPFVLAKSAPVSAALAAIDRGERPTGAAWRTIEVLQQYDVLTAAQAETVRGWQASDKAAATARRAAEKKALDEATPAPLKTLAAIGRRWNRDELALEEIAELADPLRAVLAERKATEPQLALALELLLTAELLRPTDIDPLRKGWRKRLVRKPDPYLNARPAVIGFATGLLLAGDHDLAGEVLWSIVDDKREWMSNVRAHALGLLAMAGVDGVLERLEAEAPQTGQGAIVHVWTVALLGSEEGDEEAEDSEVVAGRLWGRAPEFPPYLRNHYAAAAVALDRPPRVDWDISSFRFKHDRQRQTAGRLSEDARLPEGMRAWLREHAG